jgi:hypothetical protein
MIGKRYFVSSARAKGIDYDHAERLWQLECRLHRWHERECGGANGCITEDEDTGRYYWQNAMTGRMTLIADRYTPNVKRVAEIAAKYPDLDFTINGDPRGWAIQINRKG